MDKKAIIKYLDELKNIIDDVNVSEINTQIASGELKEWCECWKRAANACLEMIRDFCD